MSTHAASFGSESTTEEVLEGIDLAGRLALVTGASGGLGEETARALAACGARIVIAARDIPKAEAVAAKIRESTGNREVEVIALELDSLASVRSCAAEFLARHSDLSLLINNAGVMACPFMKTRDGFEMQFGTNHLGHFVFTNSILPALLAGAPGRIVNLSSGGHSLSNVLFDDPGFETTPYNKFLAYGQSKTANVQFAVGLDRRLKDRGVRAFAVHPGIIMTDLARHMESADIEELMGGPGAAQMVFKSIPAGAATSCYAATRADLEGGVYLEDCHVAEVNDTEGQDGVRSYAMDPANAERLWALSEELVGEKFRL